MSAASYAYWNEELQQYGYWLNEGRTWVHSPAASPHASQID